MKFFTLLLLTLSSVFSCSTKLGDTENYAYFGGEIINPNNDYVVLYSSENNGDTLYLDERNRFSFKINSLKPGLFTFTHGEYQRLLIEPGDSIMVRLNTIDFDESLVFTGIGAKKNNFLIKAFLDNQSDNQKFMQLSRLEPLQFKKHLDSTRVKKLKVLDQFLKSNRHSDLFKKISQANINYNTYQNMELYPFGYYGYRNLIHFRDLPEDFYSFRKDVDYNDEELINVIPYSRFLFYHFNNVALNRFYQTATHNVVFDKKSVIYNLEKLRLMDSLIKNETIKNNLLKYTARDFISFSEDSDEISEVLNSFLEKTTNKEDQQFMNKMAVSVNNLKSGNPLPSIQLLDFNGNSIEINDLITQPTIIYFWSSNLPLLLRNSHSKVKLLREKYPNIDFIAVNINGNDKLRWQNVLAQHNFKTNSEFLFKNPNEAMNQLAINSVNKCIIVDKDKKIVNSNAFLFSSELEDQILQLTQNKEVK